MEKWSTGKIGKAFSLGDFKWPVIGYGLDKMGWHRKADIWVEEKEWYQFILILIQPVALLLFLRLTKFGRATLNLCCCTIIKTLVVLNTVDVCVYSFFFSWTQNLILWCYSLVTNAFINGKCFLAILTWKALIICELLWQQVIFLVWLLWKNNKLLERHG